MNDVERRTMAAEWRIDGDEAPKISGYGAVFNSESQDLGGFREKIAPGAFARSIKDNPEIVSLFNHESSMLLGRTGNGTLKVEEDKRGLYITVNPPEHRMDVVNSIKRGDVPGMSFQFVVERDSWTGLDTKTPMRTLEEVRLMEVGPVVFPAYKDTVVSARALDAIGGNHSEVPASTSDPEPSVASDPPPVETPEHSDDPPEVVPVRTQSVETVIRRIQLERERGRKAGLGGNVE